MPAMRHSGTGDGQLRVWATSQVWGQWLGGNVASWYTLFLYTGWVPEKPTQTFKYMRGGLENSAFLDVYKLTMHLLLRIARFQLQGGGN